MEITYPAGCPGKDNPGPVGQCLPLRLRGGKIILAEGCGIFPPLRLRRGLMNLPEATDPFGI